MGYYFVLTEYESGRYGVSERRFATESEAERRAESRRKKAGVKSARVKYQAGQNDVDIRKFI